MNVIMSEMTSNLNVMNDVMNNEQLVQKQVTRGHNIVAYGWLGAANPHLYPTPYPTPFSTQTHTQKAS